MSRARKPSAKKGDLEKEKERKENMKAELKAQKELKAANGMALQELMKKLV